MKKFIILLFFCACSAQKSLPDYIAPCSATNPNLNECFATKANLAIPFIAKGDSDYGFPSLTPLKWQDLLRFSAPGIELSLTKVKAYGGENLRVVEPEIDLEQRIIKFNFTDPHIIWAGDYTASVGLSTLKKNRNGTAEIHFKNCKFRVIFKYDLETIDGKQYAKIVEAKEEIITVDLDVRTDKNNLLGLKTEEWEILKAQILGPDMLAVCANTIGEFITKIFSVVPFDQIFIL